MSKQCMCGSQRQYANCCGPYLAGEAIAPTAEALMRSRYSAFYQGNIDYLIATHQLDSRPPNERTDLIESVKNTRWVNLLIVSTHQGQAKDQSGTVEFVAAYRPALRLPSPAGAEPVAQLHERSRFIRADCRWFYVGGDILMPYQPKRSQPCWCGSGKKFKHCHG